MKDLIFAVVVVLTLAVVVVTACAVVFRGKIRRQIKLGDIYVRLPKHRVRIRRKRKLPPPFDSLAQKLDRLFAVDKENTPEPDSVPITSTVVVGLDPYFQANINGSETINQSVDWLPFRIGSGIECELALDNKSAGAIALEVKRADTGVAVILNRSSIPAYVYENAAEKVRIGRRGYPVRDLAAPTIVHFGRDLELTLTPTPKYAQTINAPAELIFTVINHRKAKKYRYLIRDDETFTIGRNDECDLAFANPTLSSMQLKLEYYGEYACFCVNNMSEHLNLFNAEKRPLSRDDPQPLFAGDVFYMAGRDIELHVDESFCPKIPAAQRTIEREVE